MTEMKMGREGLEVYVYRVLSRTLSGVQKHLCMLSFCKDKDE